MVKLWKSQNLDSLQDNQRLCNTETLTIL